MGLLSSLLSIVVLAIYSVATALGQARSTGSDPPVMRGIVGGLVLLVFYLWQKALRYKVERDCLLAELKKETDLARETQTLREAICKLSEGLGSR